MTNGNTNNATPLHWAALKNEVEEAKRLIDNGADVNAKAENGPPLHGAAGGNAAEIAKVLIANGAEVNAKDEDGCTPLALAAMENARRLRKC